MNRISSNLRGVLAGIIVLLAMTPGKAKEVFQVTLQNPSFAKGTDNNGTPLNWLKYGGGGKYQELKIVDGLDAGKALLITDGDATAEIGVFQECDLKGGETYQVTAKVRAVEDASTGGAYLQFRFLPSNQLVQRGLAAKSASEFSEVSVKGTAPPDTTKGVIYLYTHRDPTPKVIVTDVKLEGGLPPPPPPPPAPVPPQYDKLKNLQLDITLVTNGKPNVTIVAPAPAVYKTAAAVLVQRLLRRIAISLTRCSDCC